MKRIVDNLVRGGGEPRTDQYIFIFLKFIGSVAPYDVSVPLSGGVAMTVKLEDGGELGNLFGQRFDPDITTVPAACFFGQVKVAAESFDADLGEIVCIAPAVRRAQWMELRGMSEEFLHQGKAHQDAVHWPCTCRRAVAGTCQRGWRASVGSLASL